MGKLRIINPATEELVRELEEDTPATLTQKLAAAEAALPAWQRLPLATRLQMIRRFKELLAERKAKLAELLTSEVGKPIKQSHNELNAMAGRIDFFLSHTEKQLEDEVVHKEGGMEERLRWEPLGVIANISAWNYPYFVGSNVWVPALLTGNAVLYKPSEFAALTGLAVAELMHEAGVPRDVFAPVLGSGAIGAELCKLDIDGVFFTGSYATGKRIAEAVVGKLVRLQLELGGKDPTYVCEDADAKVAAESLADGAMYNAGQSCCSVERIYVHERLAKPFLDAFVETVKGFVVGDPRDEKTYIGPLARGAQVAVLEEQVADAVQKGARVLVGGKRRPGKGYWFDPTVLTGVDHTMKVMRDESFGPIIGIQVVKSDDEAVRLMNDTDYGLTAGVYTKDPKRAERLLAQLDAGSAYWNCCDRVSPRLPWTGRRHSGIGSTLGTPGIRAFVTPKAYHLRSP